MRKRYFPRFRVASSPDNRRLTRRMVNNTKGSFGHKGHIFGKEPRNRIDLREFNLFFRIHRGKYPRKGFCKHRLSWPRRSLHQDIMSSCCWDEKRSLCLLLSMDTREVDCHSRSRDIRYIEVWTRLYWLLPGENIHSITKIWETDDVNIWNNRCFENICFREKYALHTHLSSENRCRKSSLYATNIAIECQFSEKKRRGKNLSIKFKIFPKDSEGNGKIIDRSFFLEICRGKIDRDTTPIGKRKSSIFERTSDAFPTLLDRGITESDNGELTHACHDIYFDFHEISMYAIHWCREEFLHNEKWESFPSS